MIIIDIPALEVKYERTYRVLYHMRAGDGYHMYDESFDTQYEAGARIRDLHAQREKYYYIKLVENTITTTIYHENI